MSHRWRENVRSCLVIEEGEEEEERAEHGVVGEGEKEEEVAECGL